MSDGRRKPFFLRRFLGAVQNGQSRTNRDQGTILDDERVPWHPVTGVVESP